MQWARSTFTVWSLVTAVPVVLGSTSDIEVNSRVTNPVWVGALPTPTTRGAGLPQLPRLDRVTVFNTTTLDGGNSSFGLYNHGPMVVWVPEMGTFLCAWYNAPLRESSHMRVLLASSQNAVDCTDHPLQIALWLCTDDVVYPSRAVPSDQ
eukprot:m.346028 g.346028  ORF g.346028 m.346028 type:complete len:150 (-) comp27901_c3_seq4:1365-1814(-)